MRSKQEAPTPLGIARERFPDLPRRLDRTVEKLSMRASGLEPAEAEPDDEDAFHEAVEAWAKQCLRLEKAIVSVVKVRSALPE